MLLDDVDVIADVVASAVKAATEPLLAQIAAFESIKRRLADLEQRQPSFIPGPTGEKGLDGAAGRDGLDGKDGEPGLAGKDGRDGVDGKDGAPGPVGDRGPEGPQGIPGRDGLPGVQGPHGDKGLDGKDGHDGLHGKDGVDGLGFEDLDFVTDDCGRLSLRFSRGDVVKEARVPGIVYRGVFKEGTTYERGDSVTFGGSQWIARVETTAKPADGPAWQLSVRSGRDGKPGLNGKDGSNGKDGKDGRERW